MCDLADLDVLVDLQTGAITLALPLDAEDGDCATAVELETVGPDDEWAPRE